MVDHAASMVEEIMQKGQIPLVASTPLHSILLNGEVIFIFYSKNGKGKLIV